MVVNTARIRMDVQQKVEQGKNALDVLILGMASMTLLDWAHWGVAVVTIILGAIRIVVEAPKAAVKICAAYQWLRAKFKRGA